MNIDLSNSPNSFSHLDIKLAFFDIDGTIVNSKGEVTPAVSKALQDLSNSGCKLAIASGRPYFAAKDLIKSLNISAPSMFFSGALVVNPLTGEALRTKPIARNLARKAIQFGLDNRIHCELYTMDDVFVEREDELAEIHAQYIHRMPKVIQFESLLEAQDITKVVLATNSPEHTKLLRDYSRCTPELNFGFGYGAAHPDVVFANITSPEAAREGAFYFILEQLGLNSAQVASFGDGEGDLSFIKLAGFGVAMGNAPESVRSAAPFVTKTVDQDGVAWALNLLRR